MKKTALFVIILSALLGVVFWVSLKTGLINLNRTNPEDEIVELNYWGLWEDEQTIKLIITNYQATHPKVKITYTKQSLLNYPTRVQAQIRAKQGPDIFPIHNSWVKTFLLDISPAPSSIIGNDEFQQAFYPLASDQLLIDKKIYGLPVEINGMVLFYNEDILKAAGVNPPASWQDFIEGARKMTVKNTAGQIQTAGAAMGTATNIDFWPEIIGLLFLQQPNVSLDSPAKNEGAEVFKFYTNFVTDPKNKTWDSILPSSTVMFSQGKLAYYFAPISKSQQLKKEIPQLNFKVINVPQLSGKNISWGDFYLNTVSVNSAHPKEAWEFAKYLSSAEVLQYLFEQKTLLGETGRVYPRVEMASLLASDENLGVFIRQAPFLKTWYLNSTVSDNGLNSEMINLYAGAINVTLQGNEPLSYLQNNQNTITQTLEKYQIKKK